MVDVNEDDIKATYETLLNELISFNAELAHKPRLLCITKMDSVDLESYEDEFEVDVEVLHISSVTRYNIEKLIYKLAGFVE